VIGGSRRVEADANARTVRRPAAVGCTHKRQRDRRPSAFSSVDHVLSCARSVDHALGCAFDLDAHATSAMGGLTKLRVQDFIQEIGRHQVIRVDTRRTRQLQKPS
jgi:hypothetical protein